MNDNSISYFPLDCQQDDRIRLIEKEFGLKSFAIIVKLFQKIFETEGYYCKWTEEIEGLFSEEVCGLPKGSGLVSEVRKAALKRGIFSEELFNQYAILTSEEVQQKFISVVGKRKKSVKMKKEYLLLERAQIPNNVATEGENDTRAPESFEGKGSEGKESEKNTFCTEPGQTVSLPAPFVTLVLKDKTEYAVEAEEITKWKKLYPALSIEQEFRSMQGWCETNESKRKTRKGIKKFINGWLTRSQKDYDARKMGSQKPAAPKMDGLSEEELERRRALIGGV